MIILIVVPNVLADEKGTEIEEANITFFNFPVNCGMGILHTSRLSDIFDNVSTGNSWYLQNNIGQNSDNWLSFILVSTGILASWFDFHYNSPQDYQYNQYINDTLTKILGGYRVSQWLRSINNNR